MLQVNNINFIINIKRDRDNVISIQLLFKIPVAMVQPSNRLIG